MNSSPASSGIRFVADGPIARITLDRPDRHNALEATDVEALRAAMERIDADDRLRVVVLTGSGDSTFCSGASLPQMESGEMSGEVFDTLTGRLARLRVPVICALNGNVYGGGAELALCCDFRLGHRDMRLSVPAARLGVCYPIGGLTRYVQRLGLTTASRILLAAEELEADELLRVGFLTHLFERDDFVEGVEALATRIAGLAPLAVQAMKRILLDATAGTIDEVEASALITRCSDSDDFREGISAWKERRDPRFTGR